MSSFEAPDQSWAGVDAGSAAALVAASSDLALVIDRDGIVRDVAVSSTELPLACASAWRGQAWMDVVAPDSRPKVAALLADAAGGQRMWRHVNYPATGNDVPVLHAALPLGADGRILAVGRDLRGVAQLQQRLIEAQQSMERDYMRLRHLEARYRVLLEMVPQAVLILDGATHRVLESNPAAARLLAVPAPQLAQKGLLGSLEERSRDAALTLLGGVLASGRADRARVRLAEGGAELTMAASVFRQSGGASLLVLLAPVGMAERAAPQAVQPGAPSTLLKVVDAIPEGFVVTDVDGQVLAANAAFLDMIQLPVGEQLPGQSLDRWLGRAGVDLEVLLSNLRQHGSVRLFGTTLRVSWGSPLSVEVTAVAVPHGEPPCLGFTVRDTSRRIGAENSGAREFGRSPEELRDLIGRVPLRDILSETTDLIERHCIEAALQLTGDNRASAAEMLGLSRQSLYVKLRRYGMAERQTDADDTEKTA